MACVGWDTASRPTTPLGEYLMQRSKKMQWFPTRVILLSVPAPQTYAVAESQTVQC